MPVNIKKYSEQLRRLCDDYYFHNINYLEFKVQRDDILNRLDYEQKYGIQCEVIEDMEEPVELSSLEDGYHVGDE
jgi:hypothetical protein